VINPQAGNRGRDNDRRISASRPAAAPGIGSAETTGEENAVRVLIADDHPLMVGGLRQAVLAAAPNAEIAVAHDFDSIVAALDGSPDTDLVLLDLTMPGVRGFSGLLFLRSELPSTPVIVVSGNEDRAVIRHCMEFGAAGFIPKTNSLDTMRTAIAQVLDGGRWTPPDFDPNAAPNRESSAMARRLASLTPQQIRVLMMLSQGLLNKQIAYELGVSEATVKAHVSAIFQKLGVESRTQAVILATKIETAQELLIAS
jgi:DNA-binding NarL/FixJ family response regulator